MISESQRRHGSFVLRQGRSRLRAENQASNRRLNFPVSGADRATILTAHIVAHRDFQRESRARTGTDSIWVWKEQHLPAPSAGGLYKIKCHQQGRFCRGLSVPCSSGRRGHVSFQSAPAPECNIKATARTKCTRNSIAASESSRAAGWSKQF